MYPVTGPVWPRGWVEVELYSSMTAALERGEWSAALPGRTLLPGENRYPFYRRLDGPQGRCGRAENLVPTGIRSRTVQRVVSHYTDWATRPTLQFSDNENSIMKNEDIKLLLFSVTLLVTAEAGLIPSLSTKLRIIQYMYNNESIHFLTQYSAVFCSMRIHHEE